MFSIIDSQLQGHDLESECRVAQNGIIKHFETNGKHNK